MHISWDRHNTFLICTSDVFKQSSKGSHHCNLHEEGRLGRWNPFCRVIAADLRRVNTCELPRLCCIWPDLKVSLTSYLSVLQITSNRRVCSASDLKSNSDEFLCVHIYLQAYLNHSWMCSIKDARMPINSELQISYPILASAVRTSRNPRNTARCILRNKYCTSKINGTKNTTFHRIPSIVFSNILLKLHLH